jgi:tetratricopeptide (TPR) repeat protein
LLNRGNSWYSQYEYDKAVADATKAIEIDATEARTWAERGYCRIWLGDYSNALKDLSKAVEVVT